VLIAEWGVCVSLRLPRQRLDGGIVSRLTVDGLGRMTQVVENGIGATTTYSYDALDDLVGVAQTGGPSRSFAYSSLKRLRARAIRRRGR